MMSSDIHEENVIVVVFWQFGVIILYPAQWDFIYQQCVVTWSDRKAVIVDSLYKTDAPL
jgi:hypothetical protein